MESHNRMDYLIGRLEQFNSLADPNTAIAPEEGDPKEEEPPGQVARSKGGKSGKTEKSGISDIFARAARDLFRRTRNMYAGVLGIINPSDGHPQQEHTPDWAWFRPISFNRQSWIDIWPDLHI